MSDTIIIGMLASRGDPPLPSEYRECFSCKEGLWISRESLKDLPPDTDASCMNCAGLVIIPDSDSINVLKSTRAELNREGFSDEEIDAGVEKARGIMGIIHHKQEEESY